MTDAGEIIKSGAIEKAADLLHKLLAPMTEKCGTILGDRFELYRLKNLISVSQKAQRFLCDAGIAPTAVPSRLLFPIIENSSVEDDESLQDMWAGLLATASEERDAVSPSFIETLKQLTPDDARHLEFICRESVRHHNEVMESLVNHRVMASQWNHGEPKLFICDGMTLAPWAFGGFSSRTEPTKVDVPPSVYPDTYVRLGLIRREFEVSSTIDKSDVLRGYYDEVDRSLEVNAEVDSRFEFTEYAVRFLNACHGPAPITASAPSL